MIEYGFIDDGFEVDAVEDEFEDWFEWNYL
jgi:hypothetical protein